MAVSVSLVDTVVMQENKGYNENLLYLNGHMGHWDVSIKASWSSFKK